MARRIVTLTTDWGTKDHYAAAVKGKLLSLVNQDIEIIDITHDITPMHIFETAFILKNCIDYYPPGTIHIVGVLSIASDKISSVVIEHKGSYYIGTDNGIFQLLFDKPEKIFEIDIFQDSDVFTFPTLDLFVKVAAAIVNGTPLTQFGPELKKLRSDLFDFAPVMNHNSITGIVIYIDNYGNIITNIPEEMFLKTVKKRNFTISFSSYEINKIHKVYNDVDQGDLVALFNSSGYLEIAQNRGDAASVLGLGFNEKIRVFVIE
jgi:S-adenosyl-L-methionine hydrolase (adenosine-forming)